MTDSSRVWLVGLSGVLVVLAGCAPQYDGPPRASVYGRVSVDGKPLEDGVLNFVPDGHDGRFVSVPIAGGTYWLEEVDGPNFGKYTVQIYGFQLSAANEPGEDANAQPSADNPDRELAAISADKQLLPPKYNTQSELSMAISKSPMNKDWKLTR
jgi:hypothetical protein